MRQRIARRRPFPNSKAATIEAWEDEWKKLEVSLINSLIGRVPETLQECIHDEGGNHFQG